MNKVKDGYILSKCWICYFAHKKEIKENNIFNNICFSQKSWIWQKTDYNNKHQRFCSLSHIFAHLQVLHAFWHVFSGNENTEAETWCKVRLPGNKGM